MSEVGPTAGTLYSDTDTPHDGSAEVMFTCPGCEKRQSRDLDTTEVDRLFADCVSCTREVEVKVTLYLVREGGRRFRSPRPTEREHCMTLSEEIDNPDEGSAEDATDTAELGEPGFNDAEWDWD